MEGAMTVRFAGAWSYSEAGLARQAAEPLQGDVARDRSCTLSVGRSRCLHDRPHLGSNGYTADSLPNERLERGCALFWQVEVRDRSREQAIALGLDHRVLPLETARPSTAAWAESAS